MPSREDFLAKCAGNTGESALAEMGEFIKNFSPLLTEIHKWLVSGLRQCWRACRTRDGMLGYVKGMVTHSAQRKARCI